MTEYNDFINSTGYGTGGGLCGWNCRHNIIPFNPETMTNNLKEYGLEENKEMYENHQKQRYFERNIRKYKRLKLTAKKAMEDASDKEIKAMEKENYLRYKKLESNWMKVYKEFSKKHNLRTQTDRLKI